jgi:hypothetical protein
MKIERLGELFTAFTDIGVIKQIVGVIFLLEIAIVGVIP